MAGEGHPPCCWSSSNTTLSREKAGEQESCRGLAPRLWHGENGKLQGSEACTGQAGGLTSWVWGQEHLQNGCVCIVCYVLHTLCCAPCLVHQVLCALCSLCTMPCVHHALYSPCPVCTMPYIHQSPCSPLAQPQAATGGSPHTEHGPGARCGAFAFPRSGTLWGRGHTEPVGAARPSAPTAFGMRFWDGETLGKGCPTARPGTEQPPACTALGLLSPKLGLLPQSWVCCPINLGFPSHKARFAVPLIKSRDE